MLKIKLKKPKNFTQKELEEEEAETIVTGKGNGCNTCPTEHPLHFRDNLSYREYKITGICQTCQDEVFGKESK